MKRWQLVALAGMVAVVLGIATYVQVQKTRTSVQPNPCPTNPLTGIQWTYDTQKETCTYPKFIPGRGDTGQQTNIVMSVEGANSYVKGVGSPRALFLEPARSLNNRSLTNMSDEALAALVYAQVFVEEKWFKDYNWVHPYWNSNKDPEGGRWPDAKSLNGKRYAPMLSSSLDDWSCTLRVGSRPYRLCGFGFGPGNLLLGQTWDAAQWYVEYSALQENRYGATAKPLPSTNSFALNTVSKLKNDCGLQSLSPDARAALRTELLDAKQSLFWDVMRFVWAGARQREGAYQDDRAEPEKEKRAIDYCQLLSNAPGGRPQNAVSAFALMTTIYTDAITVSEVTGYDRAYLAKTNRSLEDWENFVSERNKAIRNVELLDNASPEGQYRIQQALGVGPFQTQYENAATGDFLPYSDEEIDKLVNALMFEMNNQDDPWVAAQAAQLMSNSKLLQAGYQHYKGKALKLTRMSINGREQFGLEP